METVEIATVRSNKKKPTQITATVDGKSQRVKMRARIKNIVTVHDFNQKRVL